MSSQPETDSPSRRHVLVVSFPAFGHMIPVLELAKKLSQYHAVTFAISASKVPELTSRELISANDSIRVHAIEDGVVDDIDSPVDRGAMQRVFQGVIPAVIRLLTETTAKNSGSANVLVGNAPVDVVIIDSFLGEPGAVCRTRGIPHYIFDSANVQFMVNLLTLNDESPTADPGVMDPFIRPRGPNDSPRAWPRDMKALFLPMRKSFSLATGIIVNSCRDIELEAVKELESEPSVQGLTIHCVGPLLPQKKERKAYLTNEKNIIDWLDQQTAKSVVYISFGSVATPTPDQIKVIGQALLQLGKPFIWSLREKFHGFLPEDITTRIPEQYNKGSKDLIVDWAPQSRVLHHPSVSVFLSHCGWNSAIESVANGIPVVAWPMFADQLLNALWVVKLGAGLLIPDTGIMFARTVPVEEIVTVIQKATGCANAAKASGHVITKAWTKGWTKGWTNAWTSGGSSYKDFMKLSRFSDSKK